MISKIKKILLYIGILLVIANVTILITGKTYIYPALIHQYANIDDYKVFSNVSIEGAKEIDEIPLSKNYNKTIPDTLIKTLEEKETVAYLVLKKGKIIYEQYWDEYGPESMSNSFSIAKSYISALVGIAIDEGHIKSIEQPIGDFLPEFSEGARAKIKIKHLLTMCSGLNWDEHYSGLFSKTTEGYYGSDIRKLIYNLEVIEEPGTVFAYRSGDTQLLAYVLEAATGKSLNELLSEKIWKPLGCKSALWSTDHEGGDEKAYCCINSNARDFAKFGQLWLNNGKWKGKRIVPKKYVKEAIQPINIPDRTGNPTNYYGYLFWLMPDFMGHDIYLCQGHLGQYIIVIPDEDIVIVRLGHTKGEKKDVHYHITYELIEGTLKTFTNTK